MDRNRNENKKVLLNLIFSFLAFLTNAFISLFITPYITESIGAEAYGFVKLANDFSSYGSMITLALNSMASRFIMLENEKGKYEKARSYYTSVTVANFLTALCLLVPSIILILCLNNVFDIPDGMLFEVRLTFVWTFLNFLICLAGTTFGNCFFLKNKLYISSLLTSITSVIRAVFIIGAFAVVGPRISLMAFGAIIVTVIYMPCNIIFHKKLTPELYFDRKLFDLRKVIEVVASGVWNSITKLSQILISGLDLVITNILLGATDMGYLSVAKTVPNFIAGMINTTGNSFTPNMMQHYVRGDSGKLEDTIKTSMKVMTVLSTIPNAILITMGVAFYKLWVPSMPAILVNILSVLTAIETCITGPMQPLYQVFTLTNKIKQSSIVFIMQGICSIVLTVICVKFLNIGVFAVAGVSVVLTIIVALTYHLPMAAVYLGMPWYTFYGEIIRNVLLLLVQCIIGMFITFFYDISNTWISLLLGAVCLGILSLVITMYIVLNRNERKEIIRRVLNKIHKRRE